MHFDEESDILFSMKNPIGRVYFFTRLSLIRNSWLALSCIDARKEIFTAKTKYRYTAQKNLARQCYSVSKSVVALACGFLFDKGLLRPEDPVSKFLSEYFPKNVDQKWYNVTLSDLFHHKTGARDCIDFDLEQAPKGEVLTALFSSPITEETGKTWKYSDGNYYILARVFEKISGKTADEFLSENLFKPLGFYYHTWAKDDEGHILGGTGLYLRTEDMAKLGVLIMHKGIYGGVRYLSEEWIDLCTTPSDQTQKYGYGIRTVSENVFSVTGMNGQGFFISGNKNLVYAWHAERSSAVLGICLALQKAGLI